MKGGLFFLVLVLWLSSTSASALRGPAPEGDVDFAAASAEPETTTAPRSFAVATTPRALRRESNGDRDREAEDGDDYEEDGDGAARALAGPKSDHWNGYYDFLINEGSYKFWAVFQLATAALLIYSGFAALYYAKVNPPNADDYEDYFLRRRRSAPAEASLFLGLGPEAFQRILEAVERES